MSTIAISPEENNKPIISCQIKKEIELFKLVKNLSNLIPSIVVIFKNKQIYIYGISDNKSVFYEIFLENESFEFYYNDEQKEVPLVINSKVFSRLLNCNLNYFPLNLNVHKNEESSYYLNMKYISEHIIGEYTLSQLQINTNEEVETSYLNNENEVIIDSVLLNNAIKKLEKLSDYITITVLEDEIIFSCKSELSETSLKFKKNVEETYQNMVKINIKDKKIEMNFSSTMISFLVNDIHNDNLSYLSFENVFLVVRQEIEGKRKKICYLKSVNEMYSKNNSKSKLHHRSALNIEESNFKASKLLSVAKKNQNIDEIFGNIEN